MNKNKLLNVYIIYKNYLYALKERELFGNKYGDTEEIIKMYENILQEHGIKIIKTKKLSK